MVYHAMDRALELSVGSSYTEIVYGPGGGKLALMSAQTLTKAFVPLSGGATAVYNSSGSTAPAYYRHADWLGSSRFASLPSGTNRLYYDGAYAPYGENYAETGTTDRSFTGQNQDMVSTGSYPLYDFLMREYHPTWGRWTSPDPAGLAAAGASNPQSWNRYAYVLNNPLTLVDPLGLYRCWDPITNNYCGAGDPGDGGPGGGRGGGIGGGSGPGGGAWPCAEVVMAGGFTGPDIARCGLGTGPGGRPGPPRPKPNPPSKPQAPKTAAQQAATQYCQQNGQLAFNIPGTNIPVTLSLSASAFLNFSTTNDVSLTFPPSAGVSVDVTVGAPNGPNIPVQFGLGKNASVGTFLTPNGPSGFSLSVPLAPFAGSIKGDVKRKHLRLSAKRGWISDIQPLGCGCHGDLMERCSRCGGLKRFPFIRAVWTPYGSCALQAERWREVPTMVLSETRGL